MPTRALFFAAAGAAALLLSGCTETETGPVNVVAIGAAPTVANANLTRLDAASALLLGSVAQGLVRFDAAGEIEPALAQSWFVSDDGLRYTFRIRRTEWLGGGRVTAEQVTARLRAAASAASRNPLKPILGAIESIEPMTGEVLEISLRSPRPNLLQLLAQPEMAILLESRGTGPYRATPRPDGSVLLTLPAPEEEEDRPSPADVAIALRGERAPVAVAFFTTGGADLVIGGTVGDLPFVRAAEPPAPSLQFDPVAGLFGLAFERADGALADPTLRQALSMALDRDAIVASLGVPGLLPRATLLPAGLEEVPAPAGVRWAGTPLVLRRQEAARTVAEASAGERLRIRVAMPDQPGHRLLFAWLRRDWRAIGIDAERVATDAPADLRFIDEVAPATMAAWYLRHFTCERGLACVAGADEALAAARETRDPAERRALLAKADGMLTEAAVFVPIAAPVRWSLVSPRLTGFRRNIFGRHPPGELIADER